MGHSSDAINVLKSNKALRTRTNSYENFKDYSKSPHSNKKYKFKTPTARQLKKLEAKNRFFLEEQKRKNRVMMIFAFAVGLAVLYWFSQTTVWMGFVEGFGKYAN